MFYEKCFFLVICSGLVVEGWLLIFDVCWLMVDGWFICLLLGGRRPSLCFASQLWSVPLHLPSQLLQMIFDFYEEKKQKKKKQLPFHLPQKISLWKSIRPMKTISHITDFRTFFSGIIWNSIKTHNKIVSDSVQKFNNFLYLFPQQFQNTSISICWPNLGSCLMWDILCNFQTLKSFTCSTTFDKSETWFFRDDDILQKYEIFASIS